MKIQICSDLHLDFYKDSGQGLLKKLVKTPADVLVVAGDLAEIISPAWSLALDFLCGSRANVVYTPGNHEFYGGSVQSSLDALANLSKPNLHILRRKSITIDGVSFAGATLWFPDSPDARLRQDSLNDFKHIHGFAEWVYGEAERDREFLMKNPADVVVTHHLPHARSVAERRKGDPLNCFYLNSVAEAMQHLPQLWIHGHTHQRCDYLLGNCRVVCNPSGYPTESSRVLFQPDKVVEPNAYRAA